MKILNDLANYCLQKELLFLLIGGHAVNFYGYQRMTADLDFLISENQVEKWDEMLKKLGYVEYYSTIAFRQYRYSDIANWPIDLMIVRNETFLSLFNKAEICKIDSVELKVVSLIDLLSLKLHALKQSDPYRLAKDSSDIVELCRLRSIKIEDQEFKELALKYANQKVLDYLIKLSSGIQ